MASLRPANQTSRLEAKQLNSLFASEPKPTGNTALGLGSLDLHLAVELVDLLQGLGLGLLRIRLGIALGLHGLSLGLLCVGLGVALGFRVLAFCVRDLLRGFVSIRSSGVNATQLYDGVAL